MSPPPPPPRSVRGRRKKRSFRRRWARRLAVLAALAVPLYLVLGFYVLPWVVVHAGLPVLSRFVDGRVELDRLSLDPLSLQAELHGLRIYDAADEEVLDVGRLRAGLSRRSLWLDEALVVDVLEVDATTLSLVLRPDGTLNLSDVIVLPARTTRLDLSWLPRIRLVGLDATDVAIAFDDRRHAGATPRRFTATKLSVGTLDTGAAAATPVLLEAESDLGERLRADAALTLDPPTLRGEAVAAGLRLDALHPYSMHAASMALRGGLAAATVRWSLDLTPGARLARVWAPEVEVVGLRLEEESGGGGGLPGTRIAFERLTLHGLSAAALQRRLKLGSVDLVAPALTLRRAADGTLPPVEALKRWRKTAPAGEVAAAPAERPVPIFPPPIRDAVEGVRALLAEAQAPGAAWSVQVGRAGLTDGRARWSDAVPAGGASIGFERIDASAGPLDTAAPGVMPFEATLRVAAPSEQTLAATPNSVKPRASQPTHDDTGKDLREGSARLRAAIAAELPGATTGETGRGIVRVAGRLDPARGFAAGSVVVRALDLTGLNPYLAEAGSGLRILSSSLDLRASPRVSASEGPWPVALQDALLRAAGEVTTAYAHPGSDAAEAPPAFPVTSIAAQYGPLNTEHPVAGRFYFGAELAGGVAGGAGVLVPRPKDLAASDLDAHVGVAGFDLQVLSPVLAPLLGRTVESGRLSMVAPLKTSDGHLRARVPIAIERFVLGDRVEPPGGDAPALPIDLLVAMLRGANDSVVLPPIPLDIDLTQAGFSLRASASGVFTNLLFSIATNPLQVIDAVTRRGGATVLRTAGDVRDAALGVTGLAGGIGLGVGGLALDTLRVANDTVDGLLRGIAAVLGLGDGADAGGAAPRGAIELPAAGLRGGADAGERVVQGVGFEPGTSRLLPGGARLLGRLSAFSRERGLGLELTPWVDPALDGPALLREREELAAAGMPAARVPGGVATPAMLRNLALRRARTARAVLALPGRDGMPFPESRIRMQPDAAASAHDPAAAWQPGPPGVRFELFAPGDAARRR